MCIRDRNHQGDGEERRHPEHRVTKAICARSRNGGADCLGLRRDFDLVLHLPLRYEDETRITKLDEAREGDHLQIEGAVTACEVSYRPRRQLIVTVNDGTAAALGELHHGAGRKWRRFAVVTFGTGVGGGVVIDGQGITGDAGEGTLMTFSPDPRKNEVAKPVVDELIAAGKTAAGYALYTYAAVQIYADAVTAAGSTDYAPVVAALNAGDFKTVLGDLKFNDKGDVTLRAVTVMSNTAANVGGGLSNGAAVAVEGGGGVGNGDQRGGAHARRGKQLQHLSLIHISEPTRPY